MIINGNQSPNKTQFHIVIVIETITRVFVVTVLVLNLLYIMQKLIKPFIPLPIFLEIKAIYPFFLIASYLVFIPFLLLSNVRRILSIASVIIMLPVMCLTGIFILDTEHILSSVQADNNRYHLTVVHQFGDNYRTCFFYKCKSNDLQCNQLTFYYGDCYNVVSAELVVNPITNEINGYLNENNSRGKYLDFTYGNQPRDYMNKLQTEEYDYYLAYFHDYDTNHAIFNYMLYQCVKNDTTCTRIPFQYDTTWLPWGDLELDETSGEIRIVIDNNLIFTYGDSPKCHAENCIFVNE